MSINKPGARHLESLANDVRALLNMRGVKNSIHVKVCGDNSGITSVEIWNGDKGILSTVKYKHALNFLNGIAYGHNLTL